MKMIHNDKSGRALVQNRRAPQGNVGGIPPPPPPVGTGTNPIGTVTATGTGTETGTGAGTSTSTGSGAGSGTTTSSTTASTSTSVPVTNTPTTTSSTSPTITVPSSTTTASATTTSNTSTSTDMSLTPPPLSITDSRHPFTTSTILSTFVSTLPDGEVRSFTTPIPTALVSAAPNANASPMNRTTTIVASTVSAFVCIVLVILAALFIWRRKGLKLRTRLGEQQEKGKEMRRLLEDEDFAVDDEDRWSGGGQNRNLAPSLNSGFGGPTSSLRQISPFRGPTPGAASEISGQHPLVPQTSTHARTSSTSTTSYQPSTRRPSSSNSTLLPPPSPPDTPRGHSSQERSSLQLTPVPSSSSSTWISRPISATLHPYRDPFGIGPSPPPAALSGISPKMPVTTKSPLSPPPKSFVASPQSYDPPHSPGEWLRSPKSPTFAQAATTPATTIDTPIPAATNATTPSHRPILHKKQSTADSVADSVSEYSQESAPLHVHSSRLAERSGEPPPLVPPIPLMSLRPR